MRSFTAFRSIAPVILSIALGALPSTAFAATPAHRTPVDVVNGARIAGSYRVIIHSRHAQVSVDLVLDETPDGYMGVVLTNANESALTDVQVIDNTLRAKVTTSAGKGDLVVYITDKGLVGTLRLAQKTLRIEGQRAY